MDGHPLCVVFPRLITLKHLYFAHLKVLAFLPVYTQLYGDLIQFDYLQPFNLRMKGGSHQIPDFN